MVFFLLNSSEEKRPSKNTFRSLAPKELLGHLGRGKKAPKVRPNRVRPIFLAPKVQSNRVRPIFFAYKVPSNRLRLIFLAPKLLSNRVRPIFL